METKPRLQSLDQFRGWAIVGMIAVNFLGRFAVTPAFLKHWRVGFTFADSIMPMFLFAAGMGMFMSFRRQAESDGSRSARLAVVKRCFFLLLIGVVLYGVPGIFEKGIVFFLRRIMWDALTHIAFASILAMVVIHKSAYWRVGAAVIYLLTFQLISDHAGYGSWVWERSLDGGPLGPLSWAFPLLLGTLMPDILKQKPSRISWMCLGWGVGLLLLGYLLSFNWQYSQRRMTCSYSIAATGLSFLIYLGLYFLADILKRPLPHLSTFGKNSIAIYVALHILIIPQIFFAKDIPAVLVVELLLATYLGCYAIARLLEYKKVFLKI